jgi:hypothetical protein
MASRNYTLFRNAILAEQQVTCVYEGGNRELCPYIVGTDRHGEEAVLAWQFAGESSGKLPMALPAARQRERGAHAQWPACGRFSPYHANLRGRYRSRH